MKNLGPEQDPGFPAGFLPRPRHWALLLLASFLLSAGAKAQEQTVLFDFGRHNGRDGSVVSTAPLLLFYASDWAGPNNTWYSRTGAENLFYDTFGGSAPQKSSSTIAGVTVDTAIFDGNDFFTSSFVTGRVWAGLKEFSLSLVFKSNASGSQTQTDINAFWNQRGILGFERGGAGQGEFGIGLYNDGSVNGAVAASTGLGTGDNGTPAGNINDNTWHTLTLVVKNEGSNLFSQTVYVDGIQVGSSLGLQYGTSGGLADESFSLGAVRLGSAEKFVGEVAALRFDGVPLTASEISALHTNYLGVINPSTRDTTVGRGTAVGDTVSYVWNSVGGPSQDQSGASVSFSQLRDQNSNPVSWTIRDLITTKTEGNGFLNGGLKLVAGQSNSVNPTNGFLGKLAVPNAAGDFWYAQNPNRAGFRLTNLDTAKRYRFTLFGSRNATNSRFTYYQIAGSNTVGGSLQSSGTDIGAGNGVGADTNKYDGNDARTLTLPAVTPSSDGTIFLTWLGRNDTNFPADFSATNAANSFGYLNLMQVEVFAAGSTTYLVDVGNTTTTPSANGIFWNNSSGANNGAVSSLANLVSSDGQTSNITLTWNTSGRGAGGGWGVSFGPNGSPLNVATAYPDGIYLDTANPARFTLGNLQTNQSYQLELFGSRSTNEVRATRFRIIGATTNEIVQTNSGQDLGGPGIPYNRSIASAQVVPAANGTVSVDITREQGTYGHLNAMAISIISSVPTTPSITSALTATATGGSFFSYQITANSSPTSYDATGLPSGLSINTTTGLISGTPSQNGVFNVTLSATNAGGPVSATLVLTVTATIPVITSSSSASGVAGFPFQYQII
ncbi:MAG: putative Ig domain-containing protein, partial [Sphaerospermopsis kisseleviana]